MKQSKRIASALLCAVMLFGLLPGITVPTAAVTRFDSLEGMSEAEYDELLYELERTFRFGEVFNDEAGILQGYILDTYAFAGLRTYIDYFDRGNADIYTINGVSIVEGGSLDPLGRFEYAYAVFDGKNVDWILDNVFNLEPTHAVEAAGPYGFYYYEGKYYCNWSEAGLAGAWADIAQFSHIVNDDYYAVVNYAFEFGGEYTHYIMLRRKTMADTGQEYWSYVKISNTPFTPTYSAVPTASTVLVNGQSKGFEAYTIDGYNYFKLRDLACVLSGTEAQFEVGWDGANNAISMTRGEAYTQAGGELAQSGGGVQTAAPTDATVYVDGEAVAFTAYMIGGYNYFKLRDIGAVIDFGVGWDGVSGTITIDTSVGYGA